MKTLTTLCATLLTIAAYATPATDADTLVIRFGNRTKMIIQSDNKAGVQSLTAYDLNKIVRDMGMKLDSVPNGQTYVIDETNGQRYLRDTVLVVTRKNGNITVTVNDRGTNRRDTTNNTDHAYKKTVQERFRSTSGWKVSTDFHIGLNTWVKQGNGAGTPDLSPLGSRYFAISLSQNPTIARGKTAKFSVRYGLQFAWNNFMFQDDVKAEKGTNQVEFRPVAEALSKSKLTVASLELPVMPQLTFYNASGRRSFGLGIGGFVGYRLDSYTKIKYESNGDKKHDHGGFNLNDLQYGLIANVGILKTNLFVKYNLNSSFQAGKGPDVRALSFGISF